MNKEKLIEKLKSFKTWLFGIGIGTLAVAIWWIVKIALCATTGICLLF